MNVVASKRKQSGITLIGFIIVMVVAGFFAYMGMVLGPASGKLLARQIVTGTVPAEIRAFDPLR